MPDEPQFPTYNGPTTPAAKRPGAIGVGALAVLSGTFYMLRDGAPLWVPLLIIALTLLLILLIAAIVKNRSTLTDREHLTVLTPFETRKTAWRDIQAIEVEQTWNGAEYAAVYDRDGRRIKLPHVNSWSVPMLAPEVAHLREIWTRLRGEDWSEHPDSRE